MRSWRVMLLCCLTAAALPVDTRAQGVGQRIRKKVADVTGRNEQKDASQPDRTRVYDGDVLELTEPVMKGFMNGVRTEMALLEEFAGLMDTYKRPEEYERCRQETAQSPEGMEIGLRLVNLPDNVSADEMQRVIAKVNEELNALTRKKCGPDASEDWPPAKRRERVEAIVARAADAAGPVRPPRPLPAPSGGPAIEEDGLEPQATQGAGMTLRQYGITLERAENYCRLLESGAIQPLQPVVHPSSDGKVYWVYSEVEARAIEPHCEELKKIQEARNGFNLRVYWEVTGNYGKL